MARIASPFTVYAVALYAALDSDDPAAREHARATLDRLEADPAAIDQLREARAHLEATRNGEDPNTLLSSVRRPAP